MDTDGLEFDVQLQDVQTLNEWALQGRLSVTKLSYGVLPLVLDKYIVLNSGSALGRGVGPLLITNNESEIINVEENTIAIPGENTTAHLLFSLAYPKAKNKVFLRYDEIENFVLARKGLGVIIHENRFTYESKGLKKIIDLGNYWEKETSNPIPLGGIVINRKLWPSLHKKVDELIKKSIEYAFSKYPQLNDYIRSHAQEMSEDIMRKHIDLYVNDYSLDLKEEGKQAIKKLLEVHHYINNSPVDNTNIFVP
jgi:1,4-dihydroxy-6-naphthoate synthase